MDQPLAEKKTANYLKDIAALSICKTNPILRVHFNRESENIAAEINESSSLKQEKNIECKFCYSSSPIVKILSKSNNHKTKPKIKRAVTICRVCKHKYPKKMCSEMRPRKNYVPSTTKSDNLVNVKVKEEPKNVEKNKVLKKKNKDVNAGLIIPASFESSKLRQDKRSFNKKQGKISNDNQKLSQILSTMNTANNPESFHNKLDKFFDFNE